MNSLPVRRGMRSSHHGVRNAAKLTVCRAAVARAVTGFVVRLGTAPTAPQRLRNTRSEEPAPRRAAERLIAGRAARSRPGGGAGAEKSPPHPISCVVGRLNGYERDDAAGAHDRDRQPGIIARGGRGRGPGCGTSSAAGSPTRATPRTSCRSLAAVGGSQPVADADRARHGLALHRRAQPHHRSPPQAEAGELLRPRRHRRGRRTVGPGGAAALARCGPRRALRTAGAAR